MTTKNQQLSQQAWRELDGLNSWMSERQHAGLEPLRYFIRTFGCQQNENDSEYMAGILEAAGFLPGASYEDADIILINSCSIRENADDRLFGHLGYLKRLADQRKDPLVVGVCGCMVTRPQLVEKMNRSYGYVKILMTPQQLHLLPAKLTDVYLHDTPAKTTSMDEYMVEGLPIKRERKFRALVSIMYGCNHFCTYCVVPFARGRQRSRDAQAIIDEVSELVRDGYSEFMLLGQNVNAWGLDDGPPALRFARTRGEADLLRAASGEGDVRTFPELLAALAAIDGVGCLRYMSPHPRDFTPQMVKALELFPEIESRLHLPLQSGSDRILKEMNRGYTLAEFEDLVRAARKARPELSLTTDIIVGFPGETEEDFEATLEAVKRLEFEAAFTFIFSPRPGTRAAKLPELPREVTQPRFERLLEVQNQLTRESYERLVGTEQEIMLEGPSKQDPEIYTGRDHAFHLYNVALDPARGPWEGRKVRIEVTGARPFSAEGRVLREVNS